MYRYMLFESSRSHPHWFHVEDRQVSFDILVAWARAVCGWVYTKATQLQARERILSGPRGQVGTHWTAKSFCTKKPFCRKNIFKVTIFFGDFWKLLPKEDFPAKTDPDFKFLCSFGSTYVCEEFFSNHNFAKNKYT